MTDEETWMQKLAVLPPLAVPDGPVVVLAPHPDDETLGAGALIATLTAWGVPVTVVAATDGENAYETGEAERLELGKTREMEQRSALGVLGVPASAIVRLRLTDSGLAGQEAALTDRLGEVCRPGVTLVAPWRGDFHPDHEACARAAAAVAGAKGLPLLSYFFWTWHCGRPEVLEGLALRRFEPGAEAMALKARALAEHSSQLERADGEPILPERLLGPSRWPFEMFLPA